MASAALSSFLMNWSERLRRSEEHTSELQSLAYLVCRLLLEKKKTAELYSIVAALRSASYRSSLIPDAPTPCWAVGTPFVARAVLCVEVVARVPVGPDIALSA